MALCEGVQSLNWARGLLENLGINVRQEGATVVETDSKAAIDWVRKGKGDQSH